MPKHKDLLKRHRDVIPNWIMLNYEEPIEIVSGEGRRVTDGEGNEYLDFLGGILTTMSGYAVPEILEAIQKQAEKMMHTSTLYLIEPMIELAEKIASLSNIKDAKVFFTTSGTEATDTALLLATIHKNSNEILAMRNSYHGRSFSAQAITGTQSWTSTSISGLSVNFVHGSNHYRSPFGDLDDQGYIDACVQDLKEVISVATSGNVAAMIAEPIQGVGGFAHGPDGIFKAFKEVLDEHDILFISDEVQTGWGRTGENFWGYEAHDIVPDIMTFAKGAGNGLSIGGVVASAEIMDGLKSNSISTFGGNPLSCAGALANIEYLLSNELQTNALKMGQRLLNGLNDLKETTEWLGDVRGKGLMIAMDLVTDKASRTADTARANALMEETKKGGLLLGKGGVAGNCLRVAPPLSVTEDEIDEALGIITTAAEKI